MVTSAKTCARKKQYWTFLKAYRDLNDLKKKYPNELFEIYKCKICGYHHIGHQVDRFFKNKYIPKDETFLFNVRNVSPLKGRK